MKNHKGIITSLLLFLSLSGTAQARILTVNFDFTANGNVFLPVSMKLEIDNPIVSDSGGDRIIGYFGKPIIDSPLNSVWNKLTNYKDWTVGDNSSSSFMKTAISTSYRPQPYTTDTKFYDDEFIKMNGEVKDNGASFILNNAFFSYDRNMSANELISNLELEMKAINNPPFQVIFWSKEYTSLIVNGIDWGVDFTKPHTVSRLTGTARISSLSISEVPLPPSIFLMLSSLLGILMISNTKEIINEA
ncbi:MAG: hypothetical protein WCS87_12060 [Methylococcaceae bacterium]